MNSALIVNCLRLCSQRPGKTGFDSPCRVCPANAVNMNDYVAHCHEVYAEAADMLEEYIPRLMTLEEIKALPDYVFLEDRDISHAFSIKTISRPALPQLVFVNISGEECVGFRGPDGDTSLVTSRYGVEWRCWTSRPPDAQRAAEPWE